MLLLSLIFFFAGGSGNIGGPAVQRKSPKGGGSRGAVKTC